jgi:hypothetical protein
MEEVGAGASRGRRDSRAVRHDAPRQSIRTTRSAATHRPPPDGRPAISPAHGPLPEHARRKRLHLYRAGNQSAAMHQRGRADDRQPQLDPRQFTQPGGPPQRSHRVRRAGPGRHHHDRRRLAAEAAINLLLTDATVAVLAHGWTERIATRIEILAKARAKGCTFTSCDTPLEWCQRHHITTWADDGTTDLNNLTNRQYVRHEVGRSLTRLDGHCPLALSSACGPGAQGLARRAAPPSVGARLAHRGRSRRRRQGCPASLLPGR